jgi:hypothetical protein
VSGVLGFGQFEDEIVVATMFQALGSRKNGVGVGEHTQGGGEFFFRKTESANRFLMKK